MSKPRQIDARAIALWIAGVLLSLGSAAHGEGVTSGRWGVGFPEDDWEMTEIVPEEMEDVPPTTAPATAPAPAPPPAPAPVTTPTPPPEPIVDRAADDAALRDLRLLFERAIVEKKPELLRPHLSAEFSAAMLTGDMVTGYQALVEYSREMQSLFGHGGSYKITIRPMSASYLGGDLAVAWGTTANTVTTGKGREYKFEGLWTAVARKEDGKWKILRVQGTMDPLTNPLVTATQKQLAINVGLVTAVLCLGLGAYAALYIRRRREEAASRP